MPRLVVLFAVLCAGCAAPADTVPEGAEPAVEPAPEPEPEPIAPREGHWLVDSRSVLKDECGGILGEDVAAAEQEDPDTFELWGDDEAFTIEITFDDGESYEIDCELVSDDGAFVCVGGGDLYTIDDTILSVHWDGGGALADDATLTATLDATASCEGSLCGVAEAYLGAQLPCDGTIAMDASLLEEAGGA